MKKISSLILAILILITPVFSFAQLLPSCATGPGNCTLCDMIKLFINWTNFSASAVGTLAVFFFVIGGFYWIFSMGNEERITKGKKMMINSLIGVFVVFFAWMIVGLLVQTLTNTKITDDITKINLFPSANPTKWFEITCEKTLASGDCAGYSVGTACKVGALDTNTLCYWTDETKKSADGICGKKIAGDDAKSTTTASCACIDYCEYYVKLAPNQYSGYTCQAATDIEKGGYDYISEDLCGRNSSAKPTEYCAKSY